MAIAAVKADQDIIEIISGAEIDETGLTLRGQLDRKQYEAVSKFLDLAGAKWNRSAKRHIFQPGAKAKIEALLGSGEIVNEKKQFQAFYTPAAIAAELVELAGVEPWMACLEPSAGAGAIADAIRSKGAYVRCVELNAEEAQRLEEKGYDVEAEDFLERNPSDTLPYDRVLMNPPFANDQDIKHVMHAFRFLKPGGKLYAIMSPGFLLTEHRNTRAAFNAFVHEHGCVVKELPAGAFKESGTMIRTVIVELTAHG